MADEVRNAFDTVYSDGPSSNPDEPSKAEIRSVLGGTIQTEVDKLRGLITSSTQWKPPVDLATTANVALSGEQTIDGVQTSGSDVLVKNQAAPAQNGIYTTAAGTWERRADANDASEIVGAAVFIRSGTVNAGKQFVCGTPAPITIGSTALTFTEIADQSALNATLAEKADEVPFADFLRESRENLFPAADGQGMMDEYWQTVFLAAADGSVNAGITRDGVARFASTLEAPGIPALLDDYLWVVVTEANDLVFGYHFENGWVDALGALDVQAFDRVVSSVSRVFAVKDGETVVPITFGENNAFAVGKAGSDITYVEDIAGTLTAEREDVSAETSLLDTVSTVIYHALHGQSLSDGTSSTPAISTSAVRPGRAVMFNVGPAVRGNLDANVETPRENRLSIIDLKESSRETPASQIGYELTQVGALPATSAAMVVGTGRSGTAYAGLKKGTQPYANLISSIRRARIMAGLNGLVYEAKTVSFIQGEDNISDSLATYQGHLEELQADLSGDVAIYTGVVGDVLLFVDQISNWTKYGAMPPTSDVPLAQLQAALANPGKIFCVCPKYFLSTVSDGIHLTAQSSARLGAYHGRAVRQTLAGTPWLPLHISSAVRSGATIVLTYAGGDPSTDISIDTTLVSNPGSNGFEWVQVGGAAQTITSITKTGVRQLTIGLSGDPGAPSSQQIGYARTGLSGANGGPTTGPRGNIRDNSTDTTAYGDPMHNWACHQLINVS